MTDTRSNYPQDPMEDQVLDRYLASLGRFTPSPGFEGRVMARVQIAAPVGAPLPVTAPSFAARVVRSRRWPVLAYSLCGLAAASSSALTAWGVANFDALLAWASAGVAAAGIPAWQAILAWLSATAASAGSALAAVALTAGLTRLLSLFTMVTLALPVSVVGLWLVARAPHRMPSHVAR